eukprot:13539407-Heterocapsa_arctica.AAC.1
MHRVASGGPDEAAAPDEEAASPPATFCRFGGGASTFSCPWTEPWDWVLFGAWGSSCAESASYMWSYMLESAHLAYRGGAGACAWAWAWAWVWA